MKVFVSILIGYLIGSINLAYFIGKMKGFDIREVGSKNAGASNIKLSLGWKYFVPVVIFDIGKTILVYYLILYLFPQKLFTSFPSAQCRALIGAVFVIIGHCFPFYMGFRGGKGFASYIGLCLVVKPKYAIIMLAILVALALLFKYIIVATVGMAIGFPICIYFITQGISLEFLAVMIAAIIVLCKHIVNFKRLFRGEELNVSGNKIKL